MRKFLFTYLIAGLSLTACADHAGSLAVLDSGPQAPINDPDNGVFQPIPDDESGTPGDDTVGGDDLSNPGDGSGGDGSGGTGSGGTGGGGVGDSAGATQEGGSGGTGQEGGSGGSGQEGGGQNPPEGQGGGQPVPEPSTLLLVGTGLAGAALLRRRRKPAVVAG